MIVGGVTLTWVLIANLSAAVGLTLGGWIHETHKADCEKRARVFAQAQLDEHTQGPINECVR